MSLGDWIAALRWQDVIDLAIVALIVYYVLVLIRGTRAMQILLGIFFVLGLYEIADWADLLALKQTLGAVSISLSLVIVVVFQNQIRQALTTVGRNPLLRFSTTQEQVEPGIQEIVVACKALSSTRTGALIVVERGDGLGEYIENGVRLDAFLSHNLLITIFNTATPLHDGAVIVQQGRLAAAACFLPLTLNAELSKEYGTRHRAALKITQETDALAVIVSEETGKISLALAGQLVRNLDSRRLRNNLYTHLIGDSDRRPAARRRVEGLA